MSTTLIISLIAAAALAVAGLVGMRFLRFPPAAAQAMEVPEAPASALTGLIITVVDDAGQRKEIDLGHLRSRTITMADESQATLGRLDPRHIDALMTRLDQDSQHGTKDLREDAVMKLIEAALTRPQPQP